MVPIWLVRYTNRVNSIGIHKWVICYLGKLGPWLQNPLAGSNTQTKPDKKLNLQFLYICSFWTNKKLLFAASLSDLHKMSMKTSEEEWKGVVLMTRNWRCNQGSVSGSCWIRSVCLDLDPIVKNFSIWIQVHYSDRKKSGLFVLLKTY